MLPSKNGLKGNLRPFLKTITIQIYLNVRLV